MCINISLNECADAHFTFVSFPGEYCRKRDFLLVKSSLKVSFLVLTHVPIFQFSIRNIRLITTKGIFVDKLFRNRQFKRQRLKNSVLPIHIQVSKIFNWRNVIKSVHPVFLVSCQLLSNVS